jgi:thiosulfate dehydrogenase
MQQARSRGIIAALVFLVAMAGGLGAGYLIWGWHNWYASDPANLPPTPENDLIHYGWQLITETPRLIGKNATDPALRFAGNDLACTSCHLNAGLQPFAAPFVSTFATFPMMVDDQVLTLTDRINGCMRRSMNGKALPDEGQEMDALIAYIKFVGTGSPQSVRVAGMGLRPLSPAPLAPDAARGETVYAKACASCHKADGQGELRPAPGIGYSIPPLWGDNSFNTGAGMAKTTTAAAYIHANMPFGIDYRSPVLSQQDAWDVAEFMTSKPRPQAPADAMSPLN